MATSDPSTVSARLVRAVHTSPLLGHLPDDDLAAMLTAAKVRHGGRGARLARSDEDAALVVLQGAAVATVPSPAGAEVMLDLLGPGATTGVAVVLGQPDGGVDVTAIDPCDALAFSGVDVRQLLAERPALALATLRLLAQQLATRMQETVRFASTSTTERVVERLLTLAERWGEPLPDGTTRIVVPLTQDRLASWANVSRESTAKVLHDLRRAGAVRTGRRELTVLDVELLRARRAPDGGPGAEVLRALLRSIG
jgi:CRP/FNR family cyclic AMP-dependent transcriptional regulator